MRNLLSHAATCLLLLCALTVTGLVVRREFFAPPAASAAAANVKPRRIENWQAFTSGGTLMGARGGSVRIVEFSDFQCPFCAKFSANLKEIRDRNPGKLTVTFRHLPLAIHPHAFAAANAAECAGAQGRFEPFHDLLFAQPDSVGPRSWSSFAREAGVAEAAEFERCVKEQRYAARIRADMALAEKHEIRGTPSFLINDQLFSGSLGTEELQRRVHEAQQN